MTTANGSGRWPLDYPASGDNLASGSKMRESAFTPNRLTNRMRSRARRPAISVGTPATPPRDAYEVVASTRRPAYPHPADPAGPVRPGVHCVADLRVT